MQHFLNPPLQLTLTLTLTLTVLDPKMTERTRGRDLESILSWINKNPITCVINRGHLKTTWVITALCFYENENGGRSVVNCNVSADVNCTVRKSMMDDKWMKVLTFTDRDSLLWLKHISYVGELILFV